MLSLEDVVRNMASVVTLFSNEDEQILNQPSKWKHFLRHSAHPPTVYLTLKTIHTIKCGLDMHGDSIYGSRTTRIQKDRILLRSDPLLEVFRLNGSCTLRWDAISDDFAEDFASLIRAYKSFLKAYDMHKNTQPTEEDAKESETPLRKAEQAMRGLLAKLYNLFSTHFGYPPGSVYGIYEEQRRAMDYDMVYNMLRHSPQSGLTYGNVAREAHRISHFVRQLSSIIPSRLYNDIVDEAKPLIRMFMVPPDERRKEWSHRKTIRFLEFLAACEKFIDFIEHKDLQSAEEAPDSKPYVAVWRKEEEDGMKPYRLTVWSEDGKIYSEDVAAPDRDLVISRAKSIPDWVDFTDEDTSYKITLIT